MIKRRFYARHDVDEYCVVDLDARIVARTGRGEERPEILDATLTRTPTAATEPLVVDLAALFVAITGVASSTPGST